MVLLLTMACLPQLKAIDRVDGDTGPSGGEGDTELCTGWYDLDGDGFGAGSATEVDCDELSDGLVDNGDDCDDSTADVNPDAVEACNGLDDDCDGTVDSSAVCPCSVEYQGSRPFLFCVDGQSWTSAEALCEAQDNYHLVVIDDLGEQSWVWARTKDHGSSLWWWIGFHNRDATDSEEPAGAWTWVTGSASTYTQWYPTEPWQQPDDTGGNEDCAHIDASHGYWNDLDCSAANWSGRPMSYICEAGAR